MPLCHGSWFRGFTSSRTSKMGHSGLNVQPQTTNTTIQATVTASSLRMALADHCWGRKGPLSFHNPSRISAIGPWQSRSRYHSPHSTICNFHNACFRPCLCLEASNNLRFEDLW
jgi:hypothetical protein